MADKISAIITAGVLPRLQITSADARLTYVNLLEYTQKVYEDLYLSIMEENPQLYGKMGYVAKVANKVSSPLTDIADYEKAMTFMKVELLDGTGGTYWDAMEVSLNELNNPNAGFVTTNPVYSIYGDSMYWSSTPTAALASAARVWYTDKVSNLSGGGTHNLPQGWDDTLINGIVNYGFRHLGQDNKANEFLTLYQQQKREHLARVARRSKTRRRMKDIRENYFGTYYA